jgi:hypothetical protein
MALRRPPQHRGDAIPVYVDPGDSAWDNDRIKAECAEMRKQGLDPARHPVNVYHCGDSRYDLGAKYQVLGELRSAADYLTSEATRFVLRRLSHQQLYRLTDMGSQSAIVRAMACQWALEKVEGDGPKIVRDDYGVTSDSMEELAQWGLGLPLRIGTAAYLASQPLTADEKKA